MFNGNAAPSLADIAAVTGTNRSNDGGLGDGNGWWVLIILFALFGGWGNNGYGANRGSSGSGDGVSSVVYMPPMGGYGMSVGSSYTDSAIQRGFDNQAVTNKLNGLENGLCSLGYDQLAQMNAINSNIMQTGYNNQNAITQTGYNIQNAIQSNAIAQMQNTNALQTQLSNCCCENREAIAGVNYNLATDTCAITTALSNDTNAIMQNCNNNYRALHDELVQSQLDAKNEKIAEQQSMIQSLNLAASQAAQNNYLVNTLRPMPVPAYYMANPWAATNSNMVGCCAANS